MIEVFVLPIEDMVFFPTGMQPLDVVEPRYIRMINDALDTGTPVALTFLDPNDARDRQRRQLVAGIGEVLLYERHDNGSMLVIVRGLARARLGAVRASHPYIVCDAEILKEDNRVTEVNRFYLERLRKILHAWLERAVPDAEYREAIESQITDAASVVESYASHIVQDLDLQQTLLEQPNINDRIRILSSYEAGASSEAAALA